jgi:DNA modification methylase
MSVLKSSLISPIIINGAGVIVDGHARVTVARRLEWTHIAAIQVEHLSDEDLRLYAIAANRMPADATVDLDALRRELEEIEIAVPRIDLTLSGYSVPEIDAMRGTFRAAELNDLVDDIPDPPAAGSAVSEVGDLWRLKDHLLLCGDSTDPSVIAMVMGGSSADQVVTDPPYNVVIDGHVSGMGKVRHREFAMASGEMTSAQFAAFLERTLSASAVHLRDGALAYIFMDHAHLGELLAAGNEVFTERKAICVWDKGAGGMGSLYRNAHELVTVFKKGTAKHINNVQLGKHGRNRTTIWRYPGIAQQGKGRAKALSLHPTVKPVALIADIILDASPRGGVILDPFGGSGSTLVAAEVTCRQARLVELDPLYVDTIIARLEALTGVQAVHAGTGLTFREMRGQRLGCESRGAGGEA